MLFHEYGLQSIFPHLKYHPEIFHITYHASITKSYAEYEEKEEEGFLSYNYQK
jgi:hypothetical protein